jgi:glyoxylase-like metal-dependent hydrolase (beta-lactamase superfamily II)
MRVDRLADGLWRWTTPHPEWIADPGNPDGGWPQDVSCLYHESPTGIVLIDPLVPEDSEGERFWRHLDLDVARVGLPPTIVVSVRWHARSATVVRDRYPGASLLAVTDDLPFAVDGVLVDGQVLVGNVTALVPSAPGAARMVCVECACHGLLWTADLLMGNGNDGLVRPPASWFDSAAERAWLADELPGFLQSAMSPDIRIVVPAHGEPVTSDCRDALDRACSV